MPNNFTDILFTSLLLGGGYDMAVFGISQSFRQYFVKMNKKW